MYKYFKRTSGVCATSTSVSFTIIIHTKGEGDTKTQSVSWPIDKKY